MQFPSYTQSILSIPSAIGLTNLIRIVNFSLPSLYTNSTAKVSADVLYTGTGPQTVSFYLTAPPGITVSNASQYTDALPNMLISKSFYITTNKNTGTVILTLYIDTKGSNLTYSLPLIVLAKQQGGAGAALQTSTVPPESSASLLPQISLGGYTRYFEGAGLIILIVLLIYGAIVIVSRPHRKRERVNRLMGIKNQIRHADGSMQRANVSSDAVG